MGRLGGTDQELVVRIGLGDLDSLGELFLRYHPKLLSFAFRMVNDRGAADAVVQDVFLRVLRHADKFDPQQAVRPWLYTIAANLCRDYVSRQSRRSTLELAVDPAAPIASPLDQMASEEEAERVRRAVAELPDIYREIVILRMYEQLPYADIAEVLDIREGTARSRMEYALSRLRKSFLSPREREAMKSSSPGRREQSTTTPGVEP